MRVTILLFVLLGVVTLSYVRFMDPYQQNGPEILKNNWVISKTNKDSVQNEAGIISLYSADPKKSISIHQKVHRPGLSQFVKLEADMMCENVVVGTNKSYKALLFLVQLDGASKLLKTSLIAAMIDGTRRWQSYKKVFEVSPGATAFKVYAQLSRCTGTLQLKRVRFFPVKQIVFYSWIKTIIIGVWGLFFIFFLGSHPAKGKFWPQVLFVICYGGILFAMTIPDDARNYLMKIMSIQDTLFDTSFAAGSGLELDEMGHILVFFLFGMSICFLMPEVSFFVVGSTIFILAAGTELVQTLIDSRTPKIFDFYIDCFGGVMGVISARILRVLRKIIF